MTNLLAFTRATWWDHTRCSSGLWLVAVLWLAGCAGSPAKREDSTQPACCRELAPGTAFPDRSLFQLESKWTSDFKRTISLGVLHGRPLVVAMIFTSCEFACPILVNDVKRIEEALPAGLRGQVGFVLISFDSERDTPERLAQFRVRMELPAERWTLLRGEPDDVRELAALLGVNYRKDARGQYAHSNLLTLLDAQGEVSYQQAGLNLPPDEMVRRLRGMVGR